MARNLSVQEMIDAELKRDKNASVADLHFLAGRIDPAIEKLSLDDFQKEYLSDRAESPPKRRRSGGGKKSAGRKKSGAKKSGTKKTGAKKSGTKKGGTKRSGAKKSGARKSGAKKSGAKKSGTRKSGAPARGARKSGAKKSRRSTKTRGGTPSGGGGQAQDIRAILHDFAESLAGARSPADAVRVMASVDDYVSKILKLG